MIHDSCRDWRHWLAAERVLATLIVTVFLIGTPIMVLSRVL